MIPEIELHIFHIAVILLSLWSCYVWTTRTFRHFLMLKVFPALICAAAIAFELRLLGYISF